MRKSSRGFQAARSAECESREAEDGKGEEATSSVRLLRIPRAAPGIDHYGFHLTRSKWDPYPWVCDVAAGTPAALCGLRPGDCVLEVNGTDVLGLRVAEVARIVKSQEDAVTLLCWSSNCEKDCDKNSICCAPMPTSLRRLSLVLESILRLIECPVCSITIAPPAMQCQNGHLVCVDCRIRSERCPVCRDFYTPSRALLAEQIYLTIVNAFEMCRQENKLRQKLFAGITRPIPGPTLAERTARLTGQDTWRKRKPVLPTNRFLTKLLEGCAYSMDNLSPSNAATLLRTTTRDSRRHSSGIRATTMDAPPDGNAESANDLQREGVEPRAKGVDEVSQSESDSSHSSAMEEQPPPPVSEQSAPPVTPCPELPEHVDAVQAKPASVSALCRCPCDMEPRGEGQTLHQNYCYKSAFRLL
ncbi:hypothetical protein KR059_003814 [Drosophila kikkawai]|nr:hypothetical protein KR059_003814 [Drosophila kikkawai]